MKQPVKKGTLYVGTSNITLPGNKQTFPAEYAAKSRLSYYASLFNSLEVNSSFYKVPQFKTFQKWAAEVPDTFRFSVKLWKEITHAKDLSFDQQHIIKAISAADGLGMKKGCILIQFPGKINFDHYDRLEKLLGALKNETPDHWRQAVEFRHKSWYVSETFELLDEYNTTAVLHDIPSSRNTDPGKNPDFIYQRFHGPAGDYRGSYTHDFLKDQWKAFSVALHENKDVYAYFNNTIGNAYENALTLKKFAGQFVP